MIGTNDINDNIDVTNAPTRLGKLIDEIITDAPDGVGRRVQHHADREQRTQPAVQTYNAAIPGLVTTRVAAGKHVVFVDNYAAIVKDPNYQTSLMVDNLHPNAAGYAVLGDSFYGAIGTFLHP